MEAITDACSSPEVQTLLVVTGDSSSVAIYLTTTQPQTPHSPVLTLARVAHAWTGLAASFR